VLWEVAPRASGPQAARPGQRPGPIKSNPAAKLRSENPIPDPQTRGPFVTRPVTLVI
jgi:hypothetical protein